MLPSQVASIDVRTVHEADPAARVHYPLTHAVEYACVAAVREASGKAGGCDPYIEWAALRDVAKHMAPNTRAAQVLFAPLNHVAGGGLDDTLNLATFDDALLRGGQSTRLGWLDTVLPNTRQPLRRLPRATQYVVAETRPLPAGSIPARAAMVYLALRLVTVAMHAEATSRLLRVQLMRHTPKRGAPDQYDSEGGEAISGGGASPPSLAAIANELKRRIDACADPLASLAIVVQVDATGELPYRAVPTASTCEDVKNFEPLDDDKWFFVQRSEQRQALLDASPSRDGDDEDAALRNARLDPVLDVIASVAATRHALTKTTAGHTDGSDACRVSNGAFDTEKLRVDATRLNEHRGVPAQSMGYLDGAGKTSVATLNAATPFSGEAWGNLGLFSPENAHEAAEALNVAAIASALQRLQLQPPEGSDGAAQRTAIRSRAESARNDGALGKEDKSDALLRAIFALGVSPDTEMNPVLVQTLLRLVAGGYQQTISLALEARRGILGDGAVGGMVDSAAAALKARLPGRYQKISEANALEWHKNVVDLIARVCFAYNLGMGGNAWPVATSIAGALVAIWCSPFGQTSMGYLAMIRIVQCFFTNDITQRIMGAIWRKAQQAGEMTSVRRLREVVFERSDNGATIAFCGATATLTTALFGMLPGTAAAIVTPTIALGLARYGRGQARWTGWWRVTSAFGVNRAEQMARNQITMTNHNRRHGTGIRDRGMAVTAAGAGMVAMSGIVLGSLVELVVEEATEWYLDEPGFVSEVTGRQGEEETVPEGQNATNATDPQARRAAGEEERANAPPPPSAKEDLQNLAVRGLKAGAEFTSWVLDSAADDKAKRKLLSDAKDLQDADAKAVEEAEAAERSREAEELVSKASEAEAAEAEAAPRQASAEDRDRLRQEAERLLRESVKKAEAQRRAKGAAADQRAYSEPTPLAIKFDEDDALHFAELARYYTKDLVRGMILEDPTDAVRNAITRGNAAAIPEDMLRRGLENARVELAEAKIGFPLDITAREGSDLADGIEAAADRLRSDLSGYGNQANVGAMSEIVFLGVVRGLVRGNEHAKQARDAMLQLTPQGDSIFATIFGGRERIVGDTVEMDPEMLTARQLAGELIRPKTHAGMAQEALMGVKRASLTMISATFRAKMRASLRGAIGINTLSKRVVERLETTPRDGATFAFKEKLADATRASVLLDKVTFVQMLGRSDDVVIRVARQAGFRSLTMSLTPKPFGYDMGINLEPGANSQLMLFAGYGVGLFSVLQKMRDDIVTEGLTGALNVFDLSETFTGGALSPGAPRAYSSFLAATGMGLQVSLYYVGTTALPAYIETLLGGTAIGPAAPIIAIGVTAVTSSMATSLYTMLSKQLGMYGLHGRRQARLISVNNGGRFCVDAVENGAPGEGWLTRSTVPKRASLTQAEGGRNVDDHEAAVLLTQYVVEVAALYIGGELRDCSDPLAIDVSMYGYFSSVRDSLKRKMQRRGAQLVVPNLTETRSNEIVRRATITRAVRKNGLAHRYSAKRDRNWFAAFGGYAPSEADIADGDRRFRPVTAVERPEQPAQPATPRAVAAYAWLFGAPAKNARPAAPLAHATVDRPLQTVHVTDALRGAVAGAYNGASVVPGANTKWGYLSLLVTGGDSGVGGTYEPFTGRGSGDVDYVEHSTRQMLARSSFAPMYGGDLARMDYERAMTVQYIATATITPTLAEEAVLCRLAMGSLTQRSSEADVAQAVGAVLRPLRHSVAAFRAASGGTQAMGVLPPCGLEVRRKGIAEMGHLCVLWSWAPPRMPVQLANDEPLEDAAMYEGVQKCLTERYLRKVLKAKRGVFEGAMQEPGGLATRLITLWNAFGGGGINGAAFKTLRPACVCFTADYECLGFDDVLLDDAAPPTQMDALTEQLKKSAKLTFDLVTALAMPKAQQPGEVKKAIEAIRKAKRVPTIRSRYNALLPSSALGMSVQGEFGRYGYWGKYP